MLIANESRNPIATGYNDDSNNLANNQLLDANSKKSGSILIRNLSRSSAGHRCGIEECDRRFIRLTREIDCLHYIFNARFINANRNESDVEFFRKWNTSL